MRRLIFSTTLGILLSTSALYANTANHSPFRQAGDQIYISAQVAPQTSAASRNHRSGEHALKTEMRQVLKKLEAVVADAGGTMADVVNLNVYMAEINEETFMLMNEIMTEFFGDLDNPPARSPLGNIGFLQRENAQIKFAVSASMYKPIKNESH